MCSILQRRARRATAQRSARLETPPKTTLPICCRLLAPSCLVGGRIGERPGHFPRNSSLFVQCLSNVGAEPGPARMFLFDPVPLVRLQPGTTLGAANNVVFQPSRPTIIPTSISVLLTLGSPASPTQAQFISGPTHPGPCSPTLRSVIGWLAAGLAARSRPASPPATEPGPVLSHRSLFESFAEDGTPEVASHRQAIRIQFSPGRR